MVYYRHLPLEGMYNARDLGGYATPNGITKFGTFIRSEVPCLLTDEDIELIQKYGIALDIDLRSEQEQLKAPDVLKNTEFIKYISIPMYDEAAAHSSNVSYTNADSFWAEHYIRMIETQKPWFCSVLTELANSDVCTLLHCATGKDRTGLIAMALLGLCGVSNEDIIADYCVSEIYLRPIIESKCNADSSCMDRPFYSTAPNNMLLLLKYIDSTYGNIKNYLFECGLSANSAEQIVERFVDKL